MLSSGNPPDNRTRRRSASVYSEAASVANHKAAPFHKHHIAPASMHLAQPLASADHAKATGFVQPQARLILGENAGLQSPEAFPLRSKDQFGEQRASHAPAPRSPGHVHADFSHSGKIGRASCRER